MVKKSVQQNSTLMHNNSRFGSDPITKTFTDQSRKPSHSPLALQAATLKKQVVREVEVIMEGRLAQLGPIIKPKLQSLL